MISVSQHCPSLTYVNLNHTSTTPPALSQLLSSCSGLEVLKIAGVPKMVRPLSHSSIYELQRPFRQTHGFLASLATLTTSNGEPVGWKLKNLKLRLITTPNLPLETLMLNLPSLETLDVSWTDIQHLPVFPDPMEDGGATLYPAKLRKLSLISVPVKPAILPPLLAHFPSLQVLHLGAIGGSDFSTMTDSELDQLTDVLQDFKDLHTLSLARNRKLGGLGGSQKELARFVRLIGRRCQARNSSHSWNSPRIELSRH